MAIPADNDPRRWSLVSSLYGPGTFWCWFCTVASVFISWGANPNHSESDSITNDFVAAIMLPIVSAAHFFHQLAEYDQPGSPPIFESDAFEDLQITAALEAPLAVCEFFTILALGLHATFIRRHQRKRLAIIILTALFSFSTQLVLFFRYPQASTSNSTLARPFVFQFIIPLVVNFAIIIVLGLSVSLTLLWPAISNSPPPSSLSAHGNSLSVCDIIGYLLHLSTTLIFVLTTFVVKSGAAGNSTFYIRPDGPTTSFHFRFAPKSSISVTDLDQAVALSGGILTLVMSIHDAVRARRASVHNAEGILSQEQSAPA